MLKLIPTVMVNLVSCTGLIKCISLFICGTVSRHRARGLRAKQCISLPMKSYYEGIAESCMM